MLNAEVDHHLDSGSANGPANTRNGYGQKTVLTDTGRLAPDIPRDRQGTFGPQLIAKYQRCFPGFDVWQNRPLKPVYPLVFFAALRVKIRNEGLVGQQRHSRHARRPGRRHQGSPRPVDRAERGRQVLAARHERVEKTAAPRTCSIALVEGLIVQSWRRAWPEVILFYAFPGDVRLILYTTNAIEALNAKLRRAVRVRGHFPPGEAAIKLLSLVLRRAEKE